MKNSLISIHAKSFNWAGFFLSKKIFVKCSALYDFCRTLDDIADENNEIKFKKNKFNEFKNDFINKKFNNSVIKGIWQIIEIDKVSKQIVLDLFDGIETDLGDKVKINSKNDLLLYSYRVAGTVGLMMSKILNVNNKKALKGAIDLGIAMQLTNIARDVVEDKKRNREYISPDFLSIKETIKNAEIFYKRSFPAISYIPFRSRFSVIVARRIYKKIGDYILKQKNIENYNQAGKIYVPFIRKIIETILSITDFLKLLKEKKINYDDDMDHIFLSKEIDLNERI